MACRFRWRFKTKAIQITTYVWTPGKTDQNRTYNINNLQSINLLIQYWMKKNCHSSRRRLWQQPFIRILIKIIVASVKTYHSNQPLSKSYSTFFRQVYLPGYTKVFWIMNVDSAKKKEPHRITYGEFTKFLRRNRNQPSRKTFNTFKNAYDLFRKDIRHKG